MQAQKTTFGKAKAVWTFLPLLSVLLFTQTASADPVSALGRLEPEHGV